MTAPDGQNDAGALELRGASAVEMKQSLAVQRAEAARQALALQAQVDEATQEMARRREALELELAARKAEIETMLKPLQKQLAQIKEMAWTVDLYLGRDEELTLLRDGEAAPADEPITLRQMVLAMDEESLALIEQGGIDARNKDAFIDWLIADEANLDRVVPERKSIVVLVPTWQRRNYGDPWLQKQMDEENSTSHWIIRNGAKVYLLVADINVGDRLLPTRSEFLDFFYRKDFHGRERTPMEPGGEEWLRASELSDARRRHYMRIMMVLQGLIDRTVAFHPLPESGVNLLSLAAQDEGKVRIINELDGVLTSGRESFREWQRRLNAQLRPGMRIIGDFGSPFRDVNGYSDRGFDHRHDRLHPQTASYPTSRAIYLIEDRAPKGGLVIRYERSDHVYRGYDESDGKAKVRASCVLYPEDKFILPYDLITAQEIQVYLDARTERRDYLSMVPVLRAALAAKRAEEAEEAPFRQLLLGVLSTEHNVEPSEVEADLPRLVQAWKLANRWARPLVLPDPTEQRKAVAAINRDFAAQRNAAGSNAAKDSRALVNARTLPGVIAVGRRRNGQYIAYAPSAEHQNVWLDEYRFTVQGQLAEIRRWVLPTGRSIAALTMLHTEPAWKNWNLSASRSEHISGPEAAAFAERYLFPHAPGPAIALTHEFVSYGSTGVFHLYAWATAAGSGVEHEQTRKVEDLLVEMTARWKRDARGAVVPVPYGGGTRWHAGILAEVPSRDWAQQRDVHFTWGGKIGTTTISFGGWSETLNWPGIPQADIPAYRAYYHRDPTSEVLVWMDDAAWVDVKRTHAAIVERREAKASESQRWRTLAGRYLAALSQTCEQQREAVLRQRFNDDYGTDDEQLWTNHRKSLHIAGVRTGDAAGLLATRLRAGDEVVGRTLHELDTEAGLHHVDEDLLDLPIPALPEPGGDKVCEDDETDGDDG